MRRDEENYVFACEDGLFEPAVDVGDEVEDGQFAGYIRNVRQPWKEPTRLHFNRGGIVSIKRHPALCRIGDTLFFRTNRSRSSAAKASSATHSTGAGCGAAFPRRGWLAPGRKPDAFPVVGPVLPLNPSTAPRRPAPPRDGRRDRPVSSAPVTG